jgi:hypothetical protein
MEYARSTQGPTLAAVRMQASISPGTVGDGWYSPGSRQRNMEAASDNNQEP